MFGNRPKYFLVRCVLYPAPVRDLLIHLALTDLFRGRWTNAIHDEWIRSVLKNRPDLTCAQLERTRDLMNAHVRDALVRDFEDLIPALSLPAPDDRHVLAAAINFRNYSQVIGSVRSKLIEYEQAGAAEDF